MEAIYNNRNISDDNNLANDHDDDQRQKKATSFCFSAEAVWLPESGVGPIASTLEPLLRKVVAEELDRLLKESAIFMSTRPSPAPQTQAALETPAPPRFKLVFSKNLLLPIFAGNKILDLENNPLKIILVDSNHSSGDQMIAVSLQPPPKVELVVLNGDFPPRGHDSWTSQQFNNNVVKERRGKPPLIIGNLLVTLKDGVATFGNIKFTDNSSWIPCRKFKIAARVVARGGTNSFQGPVLEAMTQPFVVKEHRMGLYKKHHPPKMDDQVWRLEKIAKNGVFHRRLASKGISTVKDFLNLCTTTTDQKRLRGILGTGMSDKKWEVVLKHAKTCKIDDNISCEQSSIDKVQKGIVTKKYAPLAQGAMIDQPYFSHGQANEHLKKVDAERSLSYDTSLGHEILASTSQLEVFNLDFET